VTRQQSLSDRVLRTYRRHLSQGLASIAEVTGPAVEVRSAGSLVYDERGRQYLDCGGYGVFTLGHCHPAVVAAVARQLETHPLATKTLLNAALAAATEDLLRLCPAQLDSVCFTNSGAEAVELAVKIARANGRRAMVAMENGFHGKTMGALSLTGRRAYRAAFEPLLADVHFVPFDAAGALEARLAELGRGSSAVILEPVQGEGGVAIPRDGFLAEVSRVCKRWDALLIVDEIQTGLGRTGRWWGTDGEEVGADVMLTGKALGGGVMPVAAAVARRDLYAPFSRDPFLHTSTFAGNPLAMAAVRAALAALQEHDVPRLASRIGARLLDRLGAVLAGRSPSAVREVRGRGLMIGVEFARDDLAGEFIIELLRERVIACHSLNASPVVRFTPPATLSEGEMDWLLEAAGRAGEVAERLAGEGAGR
jgi:putrescine aminotransferase